MLRILHIEDDPGDAELIYCAITGQSDCIVFQAASRPGLEAALTHEVFDLIISDSSLPGFDGKQALRLAKMKFPHVPFVFCSGYLTEEKRAQMMAHGATDCFSKNDTARLVRFVAEQGKLCQ